MTTTTAPVKQTCKRLGLKYGIADAKTDPIYVTFEWMKREQKKKKYLLYIYMIVFVLLAVLTTMSIIIRNREYYDKNEKKFWLEVAVYVGVAASVYIFILLSRRALFNSFRLSTLIMVLVFAFIVAILMEFSGANAVLVGDMGNTPQPQDPACQFQPRAIPTRQDFAKNLVMYCGYTLIALTLLLIVYVVVMSIFYVKSGSFYSYFAGFGLKSEKLYIAITVWFLIEAFIVSVMCAIPLTYVAINRKKHAQMSTNITKDKPVMKYFGIFMAIVFGTYIVMQFAGAFDRFNKGYCRSTIQTNIEGKFPDLIQVNDQMKNMLCIKKCNDKTLSSQTSENWITKWLNSY